VQHFPEIGKYLLLFFSLGRALYWPYFKLAVTAAGRKLWTWVRKSYCNFQNFNPDKCTDRELKGIVQRDVTGVETRLKRSVLMN
jgi:hypothetical protein